MNDEYRPKRGFLLDQPVKKRRPPALSSTATPKPRTTSKSSFLRKLEQMQRERMQVPDNVVQLPRKKA